MNSKSVSAIICLVLILASSASAIGVSHAGTTGFSHVGSSTFGWDGVFVDGRLSSLGGSDLSDGSPAALLVNPAPLGWGNALGASYDHADYFASGTDIRTIAGAAEMSGFRVNFAVQDFTMDPQPVRTAYHPEGTGETFKVRDRMTIFGLSYDLTRSLFKSSEFHWSFGTSFRRYSATLDTIQSDANTMDLGTTLSWRTDFTGGWTRITGALSRQNVTDADFILDERPARLPSPSRVGLTLETALHRAGRPDDLVKVMVAYTRANYGKDSYHDHSDHTGLEALFLGAVALRYGHSTRVSGNIDSYGLGVIMDGRLLGPFTVEVDLGSMSYDDPLPDSSKTIWGAQARCNF